MPVPPGRDLALVEFEEARTPGQPDIGQRCRGVHVTDSGTDRHYYFVYTAPSLQECKEFCAAKSFCTGVEYRAADRYCELWWFQIRWTQAGAGYQCFRAKQGAGWAPISYGELRLEDADPLLEEAGSSQAAQGEALDDAAQDAVSAGAAGEPSSTSGSAPAKDAGGELTSTLGPASSSGRAALVAEGRVATLSSAALPGSSVLHVSSGSGLAPGGRARVFGAGAASEERVVVALAGSEDDVTADLDSPLLHMHPGGSSVASALLGSAAEEEQRSTQGAGVPEWVWLPISGALVLVCLVALACFQPARAKRPPRARSGPGLQRDAREEAASRSAYEPAVAQERQSLGPGTRDMTVHVVAERRSRSAVDSVFDIINTSGSGRISREEFERIFPEGTAPGDIVLPGLAHLRFMP